MSALIAFFNGKKTAIGMTCILLAQVLRFFLPEFEAGIKVLEYIGGSLGAVGVADKVRKAVTPA